MKNRLDSSEAIKREQRLYLQMLGLFVAFALVFVYNILQFTFSLHTNEGPIFAMRTLFPVISCFFSYVNAWMTLILNGDIRKKILILLGCRPTNVNVSQLQSLTITLYSLPGKPFTTWNVAQLIELKPWKQEN
ncbi:hypothetical protein COOONC_18648 [Cooperia oncophora]